MASRAPRWTECTALFGGRFDPPHLGHEEALAGLFESPGVARVLVIPSGNPPHKPVTASNEARLEMARAAFLKSNLPGPVEVHPLEIERTRQTGAPGYAWDTLQDLKKQGIQNLAFVIGADQLRDLPKWHRFPEILGFCHWIVLERKPEGPALIENALKELQASGLARPARDQGPQGLPCFELTQPEGSSLIVCPTRARAASSTEIREKLALGHPPESLPISTEVALCLKRNRLYGTKP
jgi:nicotinate (nicotinamide) nucleotide adenylyltransferase